MWDWGALGAGVDAGAGGSSRDLRAVVVEDDRSERLVARAGELRALVGVPLRGADGRKVPPAGEQRFTTAELPDDWPLEWPAGRYAFPEVYPKMPARKDYPPDQVNVDKLATFVIE